MKYSDDQINALHLAGIIHDVGKIQVPAEILTNPDGLSEAEFSIVKTHPLAGYEILSTIEFPWPIAKIHRRRSNPRGVSDVLYVIHAPFLLSFLRKQESTRVFATANAFGPK